MISRLLTSVNNFLSTKKQMAGKGILQESQSNWKSRLIPIAAISVMRVGSETFGDPIFQKGLQN